MRREKPALELFSDSLFPLRGGDRSPCYAEIMAIRNKTVKEFPVSRPNPHEVSVTKKGNGFIQSDPDSGSGSGSDGGVVMTFQQK